MPHDIPLPPTLHWRPLPTPLTPAALAAALPRTPPTPVPCRRCLRDIAPGDRALLLSYDPFLIASDGSPYRGPTAIFVHDLASKDNTCELADVKRDFGGCVPEQQVARLMAVRAFDKGGMLREAEVAEGKDLVMACERLLSEGQEADERVEYLHLHYAAQGCFAVRVDRG
ncbi:hypothetical protein DIS24_g462 [Lasiodiplodia hormozganensis]|uniref:Uncharacterized protein n=1 Tax=Lasiodiplodia hormozganensis TaxID=869390 RepID=A0AA40D612_9PEZI|nr:hypothetical protein DIS24_g462 [Lasiodiplodia hormozganensis]